MKCEICGKEILRNSQCINYKYYHNDCIENLQQENKQLQERMEYLERSNNRREDIIIEQRQEISDLEDNWDELKEYITYWIIIYNEKIEDGWINLAHEKEDLLNRQIREEYRFLLCKMETLEQGSDSNVKD